VTSIILMLDRVREGGVPAAAAQISVGGGGLDGDGCEIVC
jgi:hypothetical protein